MKLKMSINTKLTVFILSAAVLIFSLTIGYISYRNYKLSLADANIIVTKVASENALEIEKSLSENLQVVKTLAEAFSVNNELPEEEWKDLFIKMYYKVYAQNPDFYKLWDSWELQFFDTTWNKNYGRYAVTVFDQDNKTIHSTSLRSMEGDQGKYAEIKSIAKDMLWEPYWDEFLEAGEEKKFMTSISSPILINNQYAGIVAIDIITDRFQSIIENIKPYNNTEAFLVSNNGIIVGHKATNYIGQPMLEFAPDFVDKFNINERIKNGEMVTFDGSNASNEDYILSIAPINIGEHNAPWSLGLIIPKKEILTQANHTLFLTLIVSITGLLLLFLIVFFIARNISKSINKTTDILKKIAQGDIDNSNKISIHSGDEMEVMTNSVNTLLDGLNQTSNFANQIGQGNLNAEFEPLSDKDTLGNALLDMRKSLKHADDIDQKRKLEDEKRNWATQGQARFGDILRSNGQDLKELSYQITSNLINYLNLNQGAIFVIDDSDESDITFSLSAAIAYDRKKFMQKQIKIGDGLIGRCGFERKTIYMTDLPDDYIEITSGLGTANPSTLLLIPLILNDEIFGVIELASFNPIEKHQIEFIEKLSESIASTIATVKINEKTSRLLTESKSQSEELSAQEEEMRQNLEELQATQEEASRREFEMEGIIKAISNTAFTVEYDMEGNILSANDKYAELLDIPVEKIIGTNHADGLIFTKEKEEKYSQFWNDLKQGNTRNDIFQIDFNGKKLWLNETYTPIFERNESKPNKILKIGFDISEQKERELLVKDQEIRMKKEAMVIVEYRNRIKELEQTIKEAPINTPTAISKEKETKLVEKEKSPSTKTPVPKKMVQAIDDSLQLVWSSEYQMDIDEMDDQHKQLIDLANQLLEASANKKNKKEIKEHLRSLLDFAAYHFGNEEAYFESFAYENKEPHITEHKNFIKELSSIQKDYNSSKIKDLSEALVLVKKWLPEHIANADQAYKKLFKENGL